MVGITRRKFFLWLFLLAKIIRYTLTIGSFLQVFVVLTDCVLHCRAKVKMTEIRSGYGLQISWSCHLGRRCREAMALQALLLADSTAYGWLPPRAMAKRGGGTVVRMDGQVSCISCRGILLKRGSCGVSSSTRDAGLLPGSAGGEVGAKPRAYSFQVCYSCWPKTNMFKPFLNGFVKNWAIQNN